MYMLSWVGNQKKAIEWLTLLNDKQYFIHKSSLSFLFYHHEDSQFNGKSLCVELSYKVMKKSSMSKDKEL